MCAHCPYREENTGCLIISVTRCTVCCKRDMLSYSSVCLSVCLSVCHTRGPFKNGLTLLHFHRYSITRHSSFHTRHLGVECVNLLNVDAIVDCRLVSWKRYNVAIDVTLPWKNVADFQLIQAKMSLNRQNIAPCKENWLGESNDSVTHNFNWKRFCACAVKIMFKCCQKFDPVIRN